MAIPVGTIIKKAAVMFLTSDSETKKGIGTAIATAVTVLFLPIVSVVVVFSSVFNNPDLADKVKDKVDTNLGGYFSEVDSANREIKYLMKDSGYTDVQVDAATGIYSLYFISHSSDRNFASDYVNCFNHDMNASSITTNLNSKFSSSVSKADIQIIILSTTSTYIDPRKFDDTSTKNNLDLVEWAKMAYDNHWGYVWGSYGHVLTKDMLESMAKNDPKHVGAEHFYSYIKANYIGRRTVDCVGLIKSYMWYNFNSGKFAYGSHGFTDSGTESLYANAKKKGPIKTIPEVPGIGVYHKGHVGIYIGNGYVIEAMGTKYGVVKTKLDGRGWTNWFYIPGLKYLEN